MLCLLSPPRILGRRMCLRVLYLLLSCSDRYEIALESRPPPGDAQEGGKVLIGQVAQSHQQARLVVYILSKPCLAQLTCNPWVWYLNTQESKNALADQCQSICKLITWYGLHPPGVIVQQMMQTDLISQSCPAGWCLSFQSLQICIANDQDAQDRATFACKWAGEFRKQPSLGRHTGLPSLSATTSLVLQFSLVPYANHVTNLGRSIDISNWKAEGFATLQFSAAGVSLKGKLYPILRFHFTSCTSA